MICKGCEKRHQCSNLQAMKNVSGEIRLVWCDNYKAETWSELYEIQRREKVQD